MCAEAEAFAARGEAAPRDHRLAATASIGSVNGLLRPDSGWEKATLDEVVDELVLDSAAAGVGSGHVQALDGGAVVSGGGPVETRRTRGPRTTADRPGVRVRRHRPPPGDVTESGRQVR